MGGSDHRWANVAVGVGRHSGSGWVGGSDPLRKRRFNVFRNKFPINAEINRNSGKILEID
jgi:hypothetical protein